MRIEDIDVGRCRESFVAALFEDLAWLGLRWEPEVRRQSQHLPDYRRALDRLEARGLLYPCFCSRADIKAIGHAPHGPDGPLYPGTCRALSPELRAARRESGEPFALRLDMQEAVRQAGPLIWYDRGTGPQLAQPSIFGDVVLARKDCPTSYHLAVSWDDAAQGVTLVTRSLDLFRASHLHRLLQALLELPVPEWYHHPILTDPDGRRLAKRDGAQSLRSLRQSGVTVGQVWAMIGF